MYSLIENSRGLFILSVEVLPNLSVTLISSVVLAADAFSLFKEKGIFDPATAKAFRRLMEQGGQRHPMDIYVEFRGHEPKPEALVSAMGLK